VAEKVSKKISVNSNHIEVLAPPERRLLDVLRFDLELMGTKEGCGEGECGACSVIINGEVVNSCLVLFGQIADGDEILTVEGLGDAEHLAPIQQCFIDEVGTQCGICTPGMLISAHALLMKNPNPDRDQVAIAMAGNLCRCTGYKRIIDSVMKAAEILRGEK